MPENTEPTPPPERPLPDESRARLRAELLAHASDHRSSTPRWLVPAGAAAAVALVAGLGYWAISPGGSEPDGLPVTGGDETSTAIPTPSVPTTPVPTMPAPSNEGTGTPTPAAPTLSATTSTQKPGDDAVQVGTGSCEDELEFVLKGAQLAVQLDDGSSFYVKGDRFVLCDLLGGRTTVHQPLPMTPRVNDVSTYAVSSLFDGKQVVRVAGGIVPQGAIAYDVAYTFPDGHTERATTTTDTEGRTWWYMATSYPDSGGSELKLPEIEVTYSLSGVQKHVPLQWGIDTCAQANHGC